MRSVLKRRGASTLEIDVIHGLHLLQGEQRIDFGDGRAQGLRHLLGRKGGAQGDVSAGRAVSSPENVRTVENGGLLRRCNTTDRLLGSSREPTLVSADDANHRCPRQSLMRVADMHALADGPLTRPGMSGHGLVDDHNQGRVGAVVHGEVSAIEQRDAHGAEVVAVGTSRTWRTCSFQPSTGTPSMV